MWLIIRETDDIVVGTNYHREPKAPAGHRVVEWHGQEPEIEDLEFGLVGDVDPTLDDPDYATFLDARAALRDIEAQATAEIQWLTDTIPQVESMTLEELRAAFRRVLMEQRQEIRAWRYVIRKIRGQG